MSLSRDQILAALKPNKTEVRDVPELGGEVTFRALPAGERIAWESGYIESGAVNMSEYILGLIARSLVDGTGKPMFTIAEVGDWSREAYAAASTAAMEVNGIGAKAVAETEGKSEGTEQPAGAGS